MTKQAYGRRGSLSDMQAPRSAQPAPKTLAKSRPELDKLKALLGGGRNGETERPVRETKQARDDLPGKQVNIRPRHHTGVPVFIEIDLTKSGRSVSPYSERDDRQMDLNEMAVRMGTLDGVAHYNHDVPQTRQRVRCGSISGMERLPSRYVAGK